MKALLKAVQDTVTSSVLTISVNKSSTVKRLKNYVGKGITLSIDEIKRGRTLTQNAYMWELVSKIAEKINASKENVYIDCLRQYGQSTLISVLDVDADKLGKNYPYSVRMGSSGGRTTFQLVAGSSTYDTREMKTLLDGVIQEAECWGIPTMTPSEIEKLKLK